jgi:diguanylate cyclase (GGDEF)-like protein
VWLSPTALELASGGVTNGFAMALAVVCFLQYVAHVQRTSRLRREVAAAKRQLEGVTRELEELERDRTLTRFEAHTLREFLSQEDCDQAVRGLLRRFVPERGEGFAAVLRVEAGRFRVWQSQGLLEAPTAALEIERELASPLIAGQALSLKRNGKRPPRIWEWLAPRDRNRIEQLHLFSIGSPGELLGVLVATGLAPPGAEHGRQIELARRLASSITPRVRDKLTTESREDRLRSSEDMLALRTVADRKFGSPLQMLEEFLRQAAERLSVERGALFLCQSDGASPVRALARAGTALQAGIRETWQRHEQMLGEASLSLRGPRQYPAAELERLGISTLVGSALVMPVLQESRLLGLVVFSRRRRTAFSEAQATLACWSGGLLADLIPRVVSQAVVERQARLDGLTQLANRFEFDKRIEEDVESARRAGTNVSLLLFDLDHFKRVNDTYGHRAGDAVLRAAAKVLVDTVQGIRAADRETGVSPFVARYGGEELAVLIRLDLAAAQRIGEAVRHGLETQSVEFEGATIRVTASAGLASFPEHAESVAQLISAADAALYQAKSNGRNRVESANLALAAT